MFEVNDWVENRWGRIGQVVRINEDACLPYLLHFLDGSECCYAEDELQQVGPLCPHCGHALKA